jgi:SAM-dependent methyltransferase
VTGRGEPGGPRISPFDQHSEQYEDWFSGHENAYQAEIRALRELAPSHGQALEVGVGSGRFAAPLGIHFGVDPSPSMVRLARARGIDAVLGVGEALPFASTSMDTVLMVTTVCFLDDLDRAFQEARRVLRTGGDIVLGFVDRASTLGAEYLARKDESVFYRAAHFFTVPEILAALTRAGFEGADMRQTLFGPLEETGANERVEPGHGEGSFVAIRGFKGGHAAVTSVKGERA